MKITQALINEELFVAVVRNDLTKAEKLIKQYKADVNAVSPARGYATPLHIAAVHGYAYFHWLVFLVNHKADLHVQDGHGKTPLEIYQHHFKNAVRTQELNIEELENKMQRFDGKTHYSFYGHSHAELKQQLQDNINGMKETLTLMQANNENIVWLLTPKGSVARLIRQHEKFIATAAPVSVQSSSHSMRPFRAGR